MEVGGVYWFLSYTTIPPKPKWHICICPARRLFLFVNSEPYFPRSEMQIKKGDWPKMENEVSYVSCQSLITYSQAQMKRAMEKRQKDGGMLSDECLNNLHEFADNSLTLSVEDIDDICIALEPLI